jgi:hypothetical protein
MMGTRIQVIHIVAIFVIGLAASPAMAIDLRKADVNFGIPDPGTGLLEEAQEHKLLPDEVLIKSWQGGGGIVNFILSGSARHQVGIYRVACGTELRDIEDQIAAGGTGDFSLVDRDGNLILEVNSSTVPDGFINSDPSGRRYYLGPKPTLAPLVGTFNATNRTETVTFVEPGCHLVVCLRAGHLRDAMIGLVKALPRD